MVYVLCVYNKKEKNQRITVRIQLFALNSCFFPHGFTFSLLSLGENGWCNDSFVVFFLIFLPFLPGPSLFWFNHDSTLMTSVSFFICLECFALSIF